MDEPVLDEPKRNTGPSPLIQTLFTVAVLCFMYWFVAGLIAWPFEGAALGIGLICLFVLASLRLNGLKNRRPYHWFYFLGKTGLMLAIFFAFLDLPGRDITLWLTGGCFATGLALLFVRSSRNDR